MSYTQERKDTIIKNYSANPTLISNMFEIKTLLKFAIEHANNFDIERILDTYTNLIDTRDDFKAHVIAKPDLNLLTNALRYALEYANSDILMMLILHYRVNVNDINIHVSGLPSTTPLIYVLSKAIDYHSNDTIDINNVNNDIDAKKRIVDILITHGADVNKPAESVVPAKHDVPVYFIIEYMIVSYYYSHSTNNTRGEPISELAAQKNRMKYEAYKTMLYNFLDHGLTLLVYGSGEKLLIQALYLYKHNFRKGTAVYMSEETLIDIVTKILELYPAQRSARSSTGESALTIAKRIGAPEAILTILSAGMSNSALANNMKRKNIYGFTPEAREKIAARMKMNRLEGGGRSRRARRSRRKQKRVSTRRHRK